MLKPVNRWIGLGILAMLCIASLSAMADDLTVVFHDGTEFTACVDKRTDQERLWFRETKGTTTVLRSIRWERIQSGAYHGRQLTPEEIRRYAPRIARTRIEKRPFDTGGRPGWLGGPTYAEMVREALGMIGTGD